MDTTNWSPAQGAPNMGADNWRTQLPPESRQRILDKIKGTLKNCVSSSGQEESAEIEKIAISFEEKIYSAATDKKDYLRRISMKMLLVESTPQIPETNSLPSNSACTGENPPAPVSHSIQSQGRNQEQSLSTPLAANQSQACQPLLTQNIQNNIASSGAQSSASSSSALPPAPTLSQTPAPNVVSLNSNLQNISGISQNSVGNLEGQGVPSNTLVNSQGQVQGRQHSQEVVSQPLQQQSHNPRQYLFQSRLQSLLLKQKFKQGNVTQTHSQEQQQPPPPPQQQQSLLQPMQLQSSQQSVKTPSVMQPSVMQSAPLSGLPQNQQSSFQQSTQSVLQLHPQSVRQQQQPQQAPVIHQQQTPMTLQPILPLQQQQQLMGKQPIATKIQQNQLTGQQNSVSDMQLPQQQKLLGLWNNLPNLQQQQLLGQQNSLPNIHQQQLGPQSKVSGLQQRHQLLGTQSGNSSLQSNQRTVHMLQQAEAAARQKIQEIASALLLTQGQQSQPQPQEQQLISHIQSQPEKLHQKPNPLEVDMQQKCQTSGALVWQQHVIEQQKQIFQSQRALPDSSPATQNSTSEKRHAKAGDLQEEIYQKIINMKNKYFPELNDLYQRISVRLQQHDSLPQQSLERLKELRFVLERFIKFLHVSKNKISPAYKEKVDECEKRIIGILGTNNPRKPVSSLQQGQLPSPGMHCLQQSPSQSLQVQPLEDQMNPHLQSMDVKSSETAMQQNNVTSLQRGFMSSSSEGMCAQYNTTNSPPGTNSESERGNAVKPLQLIAMGSQPIPVSTPQEPNINPLSLSGVNVPQPNINPLQSHSNIPHMHPKQQQEQKIIQKQQFQQCQMQQQLMQQKQKIMQRQPAQLWADEIPQHQMNAVNDFEVRLGTGVKSDVLLQHHSGGQHSVYHHQQLKSGASFPVSSPQLLQAASPRVSQYSPHIDYQNLVTSLTKSGTPLQSTNSPSIVPSPSTPMAPSPMPGDSEKLMSGVSSLSNTGNIGHQQKSGTLAPLTSLVISTPGISASPLLAESNNPDDNSTTIFGKSSVNEQPLRRLVKVVQSMSSKELNAAVSDIGSVVSMIDKIGGSGTGNGSRDVVGEDLVAMTKHRLQERYFTKQDGTTGTRKMKRSTTAMPLKYVSSAGCINDSFKQPTDLETADLESIAMSRFKRHRIEANHSLLEEIREINQQLLDTVIDISDEYINPTAATATTEGAEGTIVKCSFSAVAVSPNLKSQHASAQMSPILPLRLFVPKNYPNCSPILLDKLPVEISFDSMEYEDLSVKAKSRLSISLRSLLQPMSLGEIARTWDVCARAVFSEYVQKSGGGNFSSTYGTWENCLSAS